MRASVVLTCYCWLLVRVSSIHPECRFHLEIQEEETKCAELLSSQMENHRACSGVWDNITCWRPADIGETVTVPCPKVFSNFYSRPGNISKNCTSDGWSETFPDFIDACGYNDPEDESKQYSFLIHTWSLICCGFGDLLILRYFGGPGRLSLPVSMSGWERPFCHSLDSWEADPIPQYTSPMPDIFVSSEAGSVHSCWCLISGYSGQLSRVSLAIATALTQPFLRQSTTSRSRSSRRNVIVGDLDIPNSILAPSPPWQPRVSL
ncbi:vasoactive intestinal polypeptide receptor 2 isoform X5 [Rattus norvegicus]|uniref:vasoactive intestinal polypeptide receptor 2 isoform X5 n=1 Tax=Rattus norvegicus TaxID=10116 RepID=UPI0019174C96|nr:vasoactive intestinal polypeptide receptor 2 isoform X5 [Rattus norvegicus]